MKRLIISSAKFEGEIQLTYGNDYKLIAIDFSRSTLNIDQIAWFKNRVPVILHQGITQDFAPVTVTIVFEDYQVSFQDFWDAYNLKLNRIRCEKLWGKLSRVDQVKAFAGIAVYDRYLAKNSWMSKAHPDTFLKNQYWTNEWK